MKPLSEIKEIKESSQADLLKRAGVTGVGVGYKITGNKKTDEVAIRVYVEEKKDVSSRQAIPKTINGVKTDVIQRTFVTHPSFVSVQELELKADTGTYDPLQGGISIGPCRSRTFDEQEAACQGAPGPGTFVFVGTLGAIVNDNATGDPMMLSNYHVMAMDTSWSVGDTMTQPSLVDGGNCPADVVGQLQRASLGGKVDCAVASITARNNTCEIVDIGKVTGTANAVLDMPVRKRGRTTELTYGIVDDIALAVTINYCNGLGNVTLTEQIGIEVDTTQSSQFGNGGDSGSVVVTDDRKVIGLYFAGTPDGTYGVANPIQAVLDAMDVSLCVPASKSPLKDIKDLNKELKHEKFELKEFKHEKFEKLEFKEHKHEKFEKNELKEFTPKELKEPKEFKELSPKELKEPKEIFENPPFGTDPLQPGVPSSLEQRLTRAEAAIAQLSHFITSDLRPDLSAGALSREPDINSAKMAATRQKLQKQAADAKQAKDNKDVEKPSER